MFPVCASALIGPPCTHDDVKLNVALTTTATDSNEKLHPTFPHPLHFSHVRYAPRHENGGRILHLRRIRHGDLNFHLFLVRISTPKADSALRYIKACHDVRPKLCRFDTSKEAHFRPRATPPLDRRVPRCLGSRRDH